jgi:exodeoxyribonuclease-5
MITLTKKQSEAVKIMATNYTKKEPITVISGFAGTGKSSIINYFIENNDLMDKTRFVTFTGKASLVLQNKGLPATTIHRLIYDAFRNKRTGKFIFVKKEVLDWRIKLLVVDEVSMVPANLLRDLMSFNIPIVALGDPGQLEPIGEDNGLLKKPDFFLDEIHRQAADNSIIRLSMLVREGRALPIITEDPFVKVLDKKDLNIGMLQWADQILCGKNNTRRTINADMRKALGHSGTYPNVGEKVICLRNYWDNINDSEDPLINGTIGMVTHVKKPKYDDPTNILFEDVLMNVRADYSDSPWEHVQTDSNIFKGFAPFSKQHPRSNKMYHEFDFGYAITVHKAQGSEFEKVLVFEERLGGGSHARWLYTAITRASDRIVIIRG